MCGDCFFSISFLIFALLVSLLVLTQCRDHIVGLGPSLPSPLRYVSRTFIARRVRHFLPSSSRVELCPPTMASIYHCVQQLHDRFGQGSAAWGKNKATASCLGYPRLASTDLNRGGFSCSTLPGEEVFPLRSFLRISPVRAFNAWC